MERRRCLWLIHGSPAVQMLILSTNDVILRAWRGCLCCSISSRNWRRRHRRLRRKRKRCIKWTAGVKIRGRQQRWQCLLSPASFFLASLRSHLGYLSAHRRRTAAVPLSSLTQDNWTMNSVITNKFSKINQTDFTVSLLDCSGWRSKWMSEFSLH